MLKYQAGYVLPLALERGAPAAVALRSLGRKTRTAVEGGLKTVAGGSAKLTSEFESEGHSPAIGRCSSVKPVGPVKAGCCRSPRAVLAGGFRFEAIGHLC